MAQLIEALRSTAAKWRAGSTALISADCYGDCLLMVISPRFALIGSSVLFSK
ncbi:hypothetical protein ALP72_200069 [Pseudomonas coronafaciens pv. coronafaciens]|nr:hypothetical protein ALP72_200069 [Pseudomonas coronafaciens pv. coronafaciens]